MRPPLVRQHAVFHIGGAAVTNLQIGILVLALVLMIALDRFINHSRLGRGIRAVAMDPNTAALMGVNKDRVIALVFVLGGLMAGAASRRGDDAHERARIAVVLEGTIHETSDARADELRRGTVVFWPEGATHEDCFAPATRSLDSARSTPTTLPSRTVTRTGPRSGQKHTAL